METGLVSTEEDGIAFRLSLTAGLGFEGSHFSESGIDSFGLPSTVPEYQHRVDVNVFNVLPEMSIPWDDDTSLEFGIPLRRINRTAFIVPPADSSQAEQDSMQRHVDLHHPTGTFQGVGDLSFWARSRKPENPWSWGLTLPTGAIEEDPYALGEQNLAHEHIQFGTGTVVPRIQFIHGQEDWIAFATLSAPFYSNRKGFTAPPELGLYWARRNPLAENWTWSMGFSARVQGFGDWNGTRDINSGYGALVADGGLAWKSSAGNFVFGLTLPLGQKVWEESGDTFDLGPSLAVSFSP